VRGILLASLAVGAACHAAKTILLVVVPRSLACGTAEAIQVLAEVLLLFLLLVTLFFFFTLA
jgi:hypothetical protein